MDLEIQEEEAAREIRLYTQIAITLENGLRQIVVQVYRTVLLPVPAVSTSHGGINNFRR